MDFLYLTPGNWFEIKNISEKNLFPFDLQTFQDEVKTQISDRYEKLGIIESMYNHKANRDDISDIFFYVDEEIFQLLINKTSEQKRHPILTFHGSKIESINSIMNNGYEIPGMPGSTIKVAHGQMYGPGIYTSSFYNKAISYSTMSDEHYYVIVNMVFLGKFKLIPVSTSSVCRALPTGGKFPGDIDTKVVYGLDQIISADKSNVVPIAVMKIAKN